MAEIAEATHFCVYFHIGVSENFFHSCVTKHSWNTYILAQKTMGSKFSLGMVPVDSSRNPVLKELSRGKRSEYEVSNAFLSLITQLEWLLVMFLSFLSTKTNET